MRKARNGKAPLIIYVHRGIEASGFGPQLFPPAAYAACRQCRPSNVLAGAHVQLYHLSPPAGELHRNPGIVYAALNLEPRSPPRPGENLVFMSYHRESDIVAAYGVFGPWRGQCDLDMTPIDMPPPHTAAPPRNPACRNRTVPRPSAFARWCLAAHGGDFLAAVFSILPAAGRGGGRTLSNRPLAAAWMSATCERHERYLERLMRHMPVDSMGRCFRNREERGHPGLGLMRGNPLWWGRRELPARNGEIKVGFGRVWKSVYACLRMLGHVGGVVCNRLCPDRASTCSDRYK